MNLTQAEAEKLAFEFFMEDQEIPEDDQDMFDVLESRLIDDGWYIVVLAVEGLPDQWVIQVYDNGECDPCFTFSSPIRGSESATGLDEYPERIAEILETERKNLELGKKA